MIKKTVSLISGPTAALIALKCPFCLAALSGLGAGVGSMIPAIQGVYWTLILGFGGIFTWYLLRSWKRTELAGWVLILGLVGMASLIYQVARGLEGALAWIPAVTLSVASLASLFRGTSSSPAACCEKNT